MGEEERLWNAVIRQALIAGYLAKDVENYGLLKVTPEGHKFLKKPKSFKIVEDADFEEEEVDETPMRSGASCAVDPVLYSMLKDLRKKMAKRLDVPPYVIFQDPSLEFGELLDEIEAIVYSGTKLNIDYFLEEIMDEDHMQDIYDYFKESVTDKIDDAMDELGDDYTEDEIRLVRIKFISEMAN